MMPRAKAGVPIQPLFAEFVNDYEGFEESFALDAVLNASKEVGGGKGARENKEKKRAAELFVQYSAKSILYYHNCYDNNTFEVLWRYLLKECGKDMINPTVDKLMLETFTCEDNVITEESKVV